MFLFQTKAQTLAYLIDKLPGKHFLRQEIIKIIEWKKNPTKIVERIFTDFTDDSFAIRSSGEVEDGLEGSLAGIYESMLNVKKEKNEFFNAVNKVILSYKNDDAKEVLVQPMIKKSIVSGVLITKDIKNGAPYTVINYDDFSGKTDTVTGGGESKCIYILEHSESKIKSERFKKLLKITKQIKLVTKNNELDIEFCFTENELFILQVRPLAMQQSWNKNEVKNIIESVLFETSKLEKYLNSFDHKKFFLSNMADWNPAEMIGTTPKTLSMSLYKELITTDIWYKSRVSMGYNKSINNYLMLEIAGRPYIDVYLSLASLLPNNLPSKLKKKILSDQIDYLQMNSHLHDKIEFRVAFSSFDFNFDSRSKKILCSLNKDEIDILKQELIIFTNKIVKEGLKKNYNTTLKRAIDFNNDNFSDDLEYIKTNGTFPFAISARHAFIGMAFLKSAISEKILSEYRLEEIFKNIKTIASEVVAAINDLKKGNISKKEFNQFCGHLRPGTYDITSDRYDNNSEFFLSSSGVLETKDYNIETNILTFLEEKKINSLLKKNKLSFNSKDLMEYIISSTVCREENKFLFTKHLSDLLEKIKIYGQKLGFTKEELSFMNINEITQLNSIKSKKLINQRSKHYKDRMYIKTPDFIKNLDNLSIVRYPKGKPNFITTKVSAGKIHVFKNNEVAELKNKILMIEAADPGYDWVLSQSISGLITMYGGANSHIAIRCAEFNIPAAIGCGEMIYNQYQQGDLVEIDAQKEIIRILKNA